MYAISKTERSWLFNADGTVKQANHLIYIFPGEVMDTEKQLSFPKIYNRLSVFPQMEPFA